jgi:hypothetical protein
MGLGRQPAENLTGPTDKWIKAKIAQVLFAPWSLLRLPPRGIDGEGPRNEQL